MKKYGKHLKKLSLTGVQPRLPFPGSRKCDLAHILTGPITNEDSWVWLVGPGETIAESGVSGTVFEILSGVFAAIVPLRCSARTWANCATIGDMVSLWPKSLVDGVGADGMVPYRLAISIRGGP